MQGSSSEVFREASNEVKSATRPSPLEGFGAEAPATLETRIAAAESRFKKDRESKALWDITIGQLDAEHSAAASADVAKVSAESKARQILAGRQAEQKIDKLTTAIARGKRVPLTAEDRALVGSVVSPEQKMALAQGVLDQAAEEQRQMQLRAEARGAKPNESLVKEAGLMKRASEAQQRQAEVGLGIVQILKTEPLTIEGLRQATGAEKRFRRAEGRRAGLFDQLTVRFGERYPNRKDELAAARDRIDSELQSKRDALVIATAEVIPQEQRAQRAETAITMSGVGREENKKVLAAELGVVEIPQSDGSTKREVEQGSLLDAQITAEASVAALNTSLAEAIRAAEEDPRLADKAVQIALERHIAIRARELATEEIAAAQALAKENEAVQVAKEKAQVEGDAKKIARADAYDKGLKAVNSFLGKAFGMVSKVGGGLFKKDRRVEVKLGEERRPKRRLRLSGWRLNLQS